MAETSELKLTTPKAENYVLQLSKHFGHKITVEDHDGVAVFFFKDGQGRASAEGETLTLTVVSDTAEQRQNVERILGSHLERFAFREDLRVVWPS